MTKVSNKQPLISVVVPVYKVEKYLDRCINSIVNQSYNNLEIILVDDGSPDNCPKMCDNWAKKDKRIKVIHKKNQGVSMARNDGIALSTGVFVSFIDSDDYISFNMIETLYNLIVKYDSDISICDITRNEKKLGKMFNNVIVYNKDNYLKKYFRINSQTCEYYPVNKLYKKSILSVNMFPSKYKEGEDTYGVLTAILKSKKIVYTNSILYFYYLNNDSVTAKYSNTDFDLFSVWDDIIKLLNNSKYLDYAILNRKRLDFTMLMRMSLNVESSILKNDKRVYQLLNNLKFNEKYLLKSSMRIDRKILIFMFCRNYFLVSKVLYFIKNMRRVK